MNVVGLQALVYGVEDIAATRRFFADWGCTETAATPSGADFCLADGSTIHLRRAEDASLPPAIVPGSTVRETVWGVDTLETLAAIEAELARDRPVRRDPDGTVHAEDPLGYAVAFTHSTVRRPQLALSEANTVGRVGRRDRRADATTPHRVVQQRMIHVVPWVPRKRDEMRDFYVERLGFQVTESVRGTGWFLRTPLSHDHHNLFLQTRGDNHGFQHVAFEVRDIDDVMLCGRFMEDRGWRTHIGPGRHVAGSNVYWYFENPAGGLVEVGCDMDYVTDHWPVTEHESIPHGGTSWYVRPEDGGRRPGHGDWPQYREPALIG